LCVNEYKEIYITGRFESGFVVENALDFSSEKKQPTDRFSATFFKKHATRSEDEERDMREKRKREQLFLEKEAKREVLFCCFCSPLCGCKRVSFKNTPNYLFSWLYYEEKTTNSLTFTAQNHAKRRSL
jgi:hypothetical protein